MSAVFKNSKKKLNQAELRKLLNDHKSKSKDVKKIDSPLAKYNDQGQLTCVLCKWVVRSESVWTLHVTSKKHKENIQIAKKLKERTDNFTKPLKRPLTPPLPEVSTKKIKGILKNVNTNKNKDDNKTELPINFFDRKPEDKSFRNTENNEEIPEKMEIIEDSVVLPEGFFDDPKLDAKARNQEYKDPIEEEWEKFLKVIKEADSESNAIIAEDQEEATTERQIEEIDEQMNKLSKVLDLEKKKEKVVAQTNECKNQDFQEDNEEELDDDFEEFLDWREKQSFKK